MKTSLSRSSRGGGGRRRRRGGILIALLIKMILSKGLSDEERKDERSLGVNLDVTRPVSNLAPRDGFVGTSARVAAIKLVSGVDKDRKVGTVAHQVGVADVVFDQTSSEDDHSTLLGLDGETVELSDVC